MQDSKQILNEVRSALQELFELEPERITLEARLYEDLEIDSIDAIDLLDRLRGLTGEKISVDRFKAVRTVADLVSAIEQLLNEG